MKKKNAPANTKSAIKDLTNITTAAQRTRLYEALKAAGSKGITTIQARHELNIMAPAPRVYELRHKEGHEIETLWIYEPTPEGYKHRCARYVLISEDWGAGL